MAVLSFLRVLALVSESPSLLSDACRLRNLESWPGGYGLAGEWVVTVLPAAVWHLPLFGLAVFVYLS